MKIVYWIGTALLCLLMLFSAYNYIFNHAALADAYTSLGYPTYLIYPLAAAKILGVVAILSNLNKTLAEWAYAGFFSDLVLAAAAHIMVGDGSELFAIIGLVFWAVSYFTKSSRNTIAY